MSALTNFIATRNITIKLVNTDILDSLAPDIDLGIFKSVEITDVDIDTWQKFCESDNFADKIKILKCPNVTFILNIEFVIENIARILTGVYCDNYIELIITILIKMDLNCRLHIIKQFYNKDFTFLLKLFANKTFVDFYNLKYKNNKCDISDNKIKLLTFNNISGCETNKILINKNNNPLINTFFEKYFRGEQLYVLSSVEVNSYLADYNAAEVKAADEKKAAELKNADEKKAADKVANTTALNTAFDNFIAKYAEQNRDHSSDTEKITKLIEIVLAKK